MANNWWIDFQRFFSSLFEALLQIRNEFGFGIAISSRFGACFQKCIVPVGL